jgi:hypothetical protein
MGPYQVPVRESEQMRCWGRSNVKADKPFTVDDASCAMESAIFVSGSLQTGQISIRHQFLRSTSLDKLRFAQLASASFKNEHFGSNKDSRLTGPNCTEDFVKNKDLPLRAVLCVRAYRKFAGLYDFALLTASTDQGLMSLQSRSMRAASRMKTACACRACSSIAVAEPAPKKGAANESALLRRNPRPQWRRAAPPPPAQLPIRIGRGYDNEIILDDAHSAASHASVEMDEHNQMCCATSAARTAATTAAHAASVALDGDTVVRLGHTRLRVRRAISRWRRKLPTPPCTAGKAQRPPPSAWC